MTPMRDYVTVSQAAKEVGCTPKTLRRHIEKGALKVERWFSTRRIRIHRDELERYRRDGRENTAA